MQQIVLGGGCFWCTEAAFKELEGIKKVTSGYAGGDADNPTYRKVCAGNTGHAEVVKIEYDEEKISLEKLLEFFFRIHNPTTKDREGPDTGTQYRSIILWENKDQKNIIQSFIDENKDRYQDEIVTEIKELQEFYIAEEKHQDYFEKNPEDAYCNFHAQPKVDKARNF